jgi:hypothetical protein
MMAPQRPNSDHSLPETPVSAPLLVTQDTSSHGPGQIYAREMEPPFSRSALEIHLNSPRTSPNALAKPFANLGLDSERPHLTQPTYQHPKHDKVFCKQCDSHQEGFHGEHELRRHQEREHKGLIKKWICIEPDDGREHPMPILPLSQCGSCYEQKKRYGAYYNAAAHLRRAHFEPKSKNKRKRKEDDEGKRGGKRGRDWPPMSELKHWMKEVEEVVEYEGHTNDPSPSQDPSDDNDETSFAVPDFENSLPDIGTSFDRNSNNLGVFSFDATERKQFGDGLRFGPFAHLFENAQYLQDRRSALKNDNLRIL